MNILQKFRQYIFLMMCSRGHHSYAKQAFDGKLKDTDYYLIVLTVCIIAICTVLAFKNEIDGIASVSAENVAKARQIANQAYADKHKSELIIVSMLNGSVVRDGSVKTVCILKASGDCE